jgi:hypothetical protein
MTAVPVSAQTIIHQRPWQEWLELAKRYHVNVAVQNEVMHFIEQYRLGELIVEEMHKSDLPIRLEQGLLEDEIKFLQLLDSKFPHRSQWYRDELKKQLSR